MTYVIIAVLEFKDGKKGLAQTVATGIATKGEAYKMANSFLAPVYEGSRKVQRCYYAVIPTDTYNDMAAKGHCPPLKGIDACPNALAPVVPTQVTAPERPPLTLLPKLPDAT